MDENDRLAASIEAVRKIESDVLHSLSIWDQEEYDRQMEMLRTKQRVCREIVDFLIEESSKLAATRFMTVSHDYALRLKIMKHGHPLSDDEVVENAQLRLVWEDGIKDLSTPKMNWHFTPQVVYSEARSNGAGIQYQALVTSKQAIPEQSDDGKDIGSVVVPPIAIRFGYKQVWSAMLNPITINATAPIIHARQHFYSLRDAQVWSERMLLEISSKARTSNRKETQDGYTNGYDHHDDNGYQTEG
jgi:hypothetical protein